MCWKHEWAKAINNLEWAKIHIERARIKVQNRNLDEATAACKWMTNMLANIQDGLKGLIKDYGISKKEGAESLEKHMRGREKRGKVEAWVKTN